MSIEKTLIIIKPDSVRDGNIGAILSVFEKHAFRILDMKKVLISEGLASEFYKEHVERPFFGELVSFITSGDVVVCVLEKDNAVSDARAVIGHTDPKQAESDTIRGMFGESIDNNAIHGSDSVASANREIGLFFKSLV